MSGDFSLSKRLHRRTGIRRTGVFQHTPQYGIIEYTAILFTHRAAKAHQTQRMIVRRPPNEGCMNSPLSPPLNSNPLRS